MKVLIVEADPLISMALVGSLFDAGHECYEAVTVQSASWLFAEHRPDAVVSEILVQGRSATNLLLQIRSENPYLPIAIMTALRREEVLIPLGAHTFVFPKPCDPEAIIEAITS